VPGYYLLFSTLTKAGRRTLHQHPERIETVNREIEQLGCRVIAQYALLGRYDFLTVVEAPDNETIAHLSADLGSRGTLEITSLPAIPADQLQAALHAEDQIGRPIAGPIVSFRPLDGEPAPRGRARS